MPGTIHDLGPGVLLLNKHYPPCTCIEHARCLRTEAECLITVASPANTAKGNAALLLLVFPYSSHRHSPLMSGFEIAGVALGGFAALSAMLGGSRDMVRALEG